MVGAYPSYPSDDPYYQRRKLMGDVLGRRPRSSARMALHLSVLLLERSGVRSNSTISLTSICPSKWYRRSQCCDAVEKTIPVLEISTFTVAWSYSPLLF